MIGFVIRRTLSGVVTLWVISILAFLVVQLHPRDFATHYFQELLGGMTSSRL